MKRVLFRWEILEANSYVYSRYLFKKNPLQKDLRLQESKQEVETEWQKIYQVYQAALITNVVYCPISI